MTTNRLIFDSYTYDKEMLTHSFIYKIHHGDEEFVFTENVVLPSQPDKSDSLEIDTILHSLHLMLGISYWKLFCPKDIIVNTTPLSKQQAEFFNLVYTKGLGEFFYTNKIDYRSLVQFPYSEKLEDDEILKQVQDDPSASFNHFSGQVGQAHSRDLMQSNKKVLTGIGGGKDSVVVVELLKEKGVQQTGFIVDTQANQQSIVPMLNQMNIPVLRLSRIIDPQLFALNSREDTYNGHVPISAIIAFLGVLIAQLYDYQQIVVGNERSADEGNLEYLGSTINHQWSKSMEFEMAFQAYVSKFLTRSVSYFSALRQYSELRIAQEFLSYPEYSYLFRSCNRNFKISKAQTSGWCGECPKCAFVYLILAPFMKREQLLSIFGEDLLSKESLSELYEKMLGIRDAKPFECVGTVNEVIAAFYLLYKKGEYAESEAMQMFIHKVIVKHDRDYFENLVEKELAETAYYETSLDPETSSG